MKNFTPALAFASIISLVNGHGFVTSPKARQPGTAMEAACGKQVVSNQGSDKYGNIQGELQVASSQSDYHDAACDIWLCKGYKFADNKDNVYSYKAGQKIDFTVDIRAPHTGVANVSVVDTSSNTVIGAPLISWPVYASVATGVKPDETSFSITMPDNLQDQCATAGDCVLQWYWYAQSIDQTYESCVDFTLGGSGFSAGSGPVPSAKASSIDSSTDVGTATTPAGTVAVQPTTTAAAKPTTTAAVQPTTTFATSARQPATSAEALVPTTAAASPGASDAAVPFPTDSAANVLAWLQAMFGNLAGN
ncbi:Chitin-binding domain 3 [Penicillium cf. griseofulvum]|uniref:Chitin-binding domain 3 n=1 Tax=Penicillium cf. griseofulvum TaxID=2972120 RepID=A0A9W9M0F4_9EURO|nr:Chitin-binding domain 3 [Penicillium cf. griseofulvum]KAJ5430684.1 Chitin-binding domain 3 [Penicillium cf. griseofulvum]KAJ5435547.1 Chitin-binding domain 3 [Penicillium cf. griseofulvum]